MLTKQIVTSSALFRDFLCRRLSHCWYDAPKTSYASVGRIYTNMSFVFKYIHEEAEAYTRFCSQISHYPVLDASCDRVAHRLLESNQATYIHQDLFSLIKSRNFSKVSNFKWILCGKESVPSQSVDIFCLQIVVWSTIPTTYINSLPRNWFGTATISFEIRYPKSTQFVSYLNNAQHWNKMTPSLCDM